MKDALIQLSKGVHRGPAADLIPVLFGERQPSMSKTDVKFKPFNSNLDHSQVNELIIYISLHIYIFFTDYWFFFFSSFFFFRWVVWGYTCIYTLVPRKITFWLWLRSPYRRVEINFKLFNLMAILILLLCSLMRRYFLLGMMKFYVWSLLFSSLRSLQNCTSIEQNYKGKGGDCWEGELLLTSWWLGLFA